MGWDIYFSSTTTLPRFPRKQSLGQNSSAFYQVLKSQNRERGKRLGRVGRKANRRLCIHKLATASHENSHLPNHSECFK